MGIGALGVCIAFLVALVAGDSVDGFPAKSAAVIAFGAMLLGVGTMLWAIGSFFTSIWKKESQTVPDDKLLDAEDGHKRVTQTEEMVLVGGSETTHERMQETAIRFGEQLEKRGKALPETTVREAMDLLREALERTGR